MSIDKPHILPQEALGAGEAILPPATPQGPLATGSTETLDKTDVVDAPVVSTPPPLSKSRKIGLICIVTFTMAMSAGGSTSLNVALPIIQSDLNIAEVNLQWIMSAYTLTSGCFLLMSGRMADVHGRKLCFLTGVGWYAAWTLIGGFMQSSEGLIVSRALAGAGAALGWVHAQASLTSGYPARLASSRATLRARRGRQRSRRLQRVPLLAVEQGWSSEASSRRTPGEACLAHDR